MTDLINWTIFNELLIMDEDEDGFSKSLIQTFIEQAIQTFAEIEEILLNNDNQQDQASLTKLSQLGHYLKGSAASLGLVKIQEQCERIQNYGLLKNFDGAVPDDGKDFWGGVKLALGSAREEFTSARQFLSDYYKEQL
ncbi:hypothetical protein WICPIJ_007086 [Wickerhamomyces pijperi]|uniref:HPt domain-containing protein n=1 Tax=Wickerhamomyces pijperi TaxID=599730 RepID=A0A9P8TJK8_WICPI|nr:hypothetical protein WICPIJ_007086 [Wickerhamomyces pijperi]